MVFDGLREEDKEEDKADATAARIQALKDAAATGFAGMYPFVMHPFSQFTWAITAASESVRAISYVRLGLLSYSDVVKRCPHDVPPCDGSPPGRPGQGIHPDRRDYRQGETPDI